MNIADFRAQLEDELSWRSDEIRFFQNQCALVPRENQDKFRRALVLLLYSNFEGLCKFALTLYINAINAENVQCKDATHAVAAASLFDVFQYLRDGTGKAKNFKKLGLPDDKDLHRFVRDREFLRSATQIMSGHVTIPERIIDPESNLNPEILRKILFRLGLPHDQFEDIEPEITTLLKLRNKIAHGETKEGINDVLYNKLNKSAFHIMNSIIRGITESLIEKKYLMISENTRSNTLNEYLN